MWRNDMIRVIGTVVLLFAALIIPVKLAHAIPNGDFRYIEKDLGGGVWQYDYTLYNNSDPEMLGGYDIYEVFLHIAEDATLTVNNTPTGWDFIGGSEGFFQLFSTMPGASPTGVDVAPGTSLAGFSFNLNYQGGMLPVDMTLASLPDEYDPIIISGTTSPDTTPGTSPVPEPSTIVLLGAGLGSLLFYRRKTS